MAQLRRKLEPDPSRPRHLLNEPGMGYRFEPNPQPRPPHTTDDTPWRTPARIGAILLPLATCAILSTLRDSITAATAVLVLVLWVVAAAATGDRFAGVLAALSGGVWFDFFLTEPYQRFTIADPDDIEATVLSVLIGVGVTAVEVVRSELGEVGYDVLAERSDEADRVAPQGHHVHLVDSDTRERAHLLGERGASGTIRAHRAVVQDGLTDLVVRPPLPVAPIAPHGELVGDRVGTGALAGEDVLRNQSQRLPLATTTNHDRRCGGFLSGCGELIVSASW
jgi:hypothetical protein